MEIGFELGFIFKIVIGIKCFEELNVEENSQFYLCVEL
jgi:hypothetical protein